MRCVLIAVLGCVLAVAAQQSTGLNFLAIGDWGGNSDEDPTSVGEIAVSAGMNTIAGLINSQFVLALGDNFYNDGIIGNCHSTRFNSTFEDVFTQSALQTPWFVLAGNHDHIGNVSAQIAYSQLSPRWRFPDFYYTKVFPFNTPTGGIKSFQVVFLDTVLLAGIADHDDTFGELKGADPETVSAQLQWLEATLANSTADYLWVAGHYPVWSACQHGPTLELVLQVRPLLIKYNVTGYMSGHDHCLEYIDDSTGPVYVVSGAGRECCYGDKHINDIPKNSLKYLLSGSQTTIEGGFVSFQVNENSMTVVYYDQSGNVLYTTPAILPRSTSTQ